MLYFPIVGPPAEIDVLLLGNRDPFLREGGRLPFAGACEWLMWLRGRAGIRSTLHRPVYTLFLLACPVLFSGRMG
jgi:hypothetical protein